MAGETFPLAKARPKTPLSRAFKDVENELENWDGHGKCEICRTNDVTAKKRKQERRLMRQRIT